MPDASQPMAASMVTTVWDGASAESLTRALLPPATDCIEAGVNGPRLKPTRQGSSCRRLSLTMTALSVYRHPIAKVFSRALQTRLDLSPDIHERVHTALQEVLMNAMLHGNLGLDATLRDNMQRLAESYNTIESRFACEQIARSMIRASATWTNRMLRVTVRDSGSGFKQEEVPSADERAAAGRHGSGRGLMILESLCSRFSLHRGGTTVALNFHLM